MLFRSKPQTPLLINIVNKGGLCFVMSQAKIESAIDQTVQLAHRPEDLGKGFAERDQLVKSKEASGEVYFYSIKNDG